MDLIVIGVLLTLGVMVWIEGMPTRIDRIPVGIDAAILIVVGISLLPGVLGWLALLAGIVRLAFIYQAIEYTIPWRKLLAYRPNLPKISLPAVRFRRDTAPRAHQGKTWFGASMLMLTSPIAAIPSMLVLMGILVLMEPVATTGFDVRRWLGYTFVGVIGTLDLVASRFLVSLPLLSCAAYVGARSAIDDRIIWKRLWTAWLAIGALYPFFYLAADLLNWFDGPFFN